MVRLNDQEQIHLQKLVRDSGLPQEKLLRQIILGYQVKAAPPIEYHELIRQLLANGNALNQIATKLNTLAVFDETAYSAKHSALMKIILAIQQQIEMPSALK